MCAHPQPLFIIQRVRTRAAKCDAGRNPGAALRTSHQHRMRHGRPHASSLYSLHRFSLKAAPREIKLDRRARIVEHTPSRHATVSEPSSVQARHCQPARLMPTRCRDNDCSASNDNSCTLASGKENKPIAAGAAFEANVGHKRGQDGHLGRGERASTQERANHHITSRACLRQRLTAQPSCGNLTRRNVQKLCCG